MVGFINIMQATAFIIGTDEHRREALTDLCTDIGFRAIVNFSDLSLAEKQVQQTPICFFLVALSGIAHNTGGITRAIRTSRNRQIRLAPIIGFTENADPQLVSAVLTLGFDDIIVPPFSANSVFSRLSSHLNRRISFYETGHYFGPDRHIGLNKQQQKDQGKTLECRKFLITRSLESGIRILKDELHTSIPTNVTKGNFGIAL